jgi:Tfp pilus assembly protein PilF
VTVADSISKLRTVAGLDSQEILWLSRGISLARFDIVGFLPNMNRLALGAIALVVVSALPVRADVRRDAKAEVEFGINVAQRGLWREAIYRWEKATQIDPNYAAAFNDLAIAYEHEGQLEKARKAYERALELDANNAQIRQNYELFKEINDRTSQGKQQQ